MSQMKNSTINPQWLAEQMRANPPRVLPNGNIFSGPVRLAYANITKPGKPSKDNPAGDGKYGAAVLLPLGTNTSVFETAWVTAARAAFPKNWTPDGKATGLHIPFHPQDDKAFGTNPSAGFTPGAIYFNANSKFKPPVVDINMNPIVDETRIYSGVWAFLSFNVYDYQNKKTGVGFGLQTVMIIADDMKLSGGGGNPQTDFADIKITAIGDVASKFDMLPTARTAAPAASVMPTSGHVGTPGQLQTQPLSMADMLD